MKKVIGLIILVCLITQTPVCAIEEHHNSLKIQVKKSKKQPEKIFTLNPFWESYNDELLNGYISEALENNLDIKIAKTRIKESEAILGTVNSQRLPRLSINPSIYPYKTISRWTGLYASHNMLLQDRDLAGVSRDINKIVKKIPKYSTERNLHQYSRTGKINELCVSISYFRLDACINFGLPVDCC